MMTKPTTLQSLWLEVSDTHNNQDDAIFLFIEYLDHIKSKAKGITYKLAEGDLILNFANQ